MTPGMEAIVSRALAREASSDYCAPREMTDVVTDYYLFLFAWSFLDMSLSLSIDSLAISMEKEPPLYWKLARTLSSESEPCVLLSERSFDIPYDYIGLENESLDMSPLPVSLEESDRQPKPRAMMASRISSAEMFATCDIVSILPALKALCINVAVILQVKRTTLTDCRPRLSNDSCIFFSMLFEHATQLMPLTLKSNSINDVQVVVEKESS